eukprot:654647_1
MDTKSCHVKNCSKTVQKQLSKKMTTVALCLDLLDEMELWIDACNERITECKENKYWNISAVPNKGYGMIAKRDIKAYTTIVVEKPILFERKHTSDSDRDKPVHQLLLDDFNQLSLNEQEIVLRLTNLIAPCISSPFQQKYLL